MKTEKDQLVSQSKQQANPYLCDPNSWEIIRDDDKVFHGQRSDELQKQADKRSKSPLGSKRTPATEPSDAGPAHSDGFARK